MSHPKIVQQHATNIKWYAEALLEENPGMSVDEAMDHATASYGFLGLPAGTKEAVKSCAASLEYSDLSQKTKHAMASHDLKLCRNWFERLCVWLNPYLN